MNAPTLLVGLGGTGSEIVQKVFERATPRQRENIGFVIFDTDVNELRVIEEKTPQIRTVQTSTRLSVGEYLDCDTYSRDNWFPVNRILNGKALTEGAGQVSLCPMPCFSYLDRKVSREEDAVLKEFDRRNWVEATNQ